ncbi:MAG TPA: hypothetical protein VN875_18100 [Candidatus Binatus sp.]|jgi:hypothetical protein|nr:hypothetical protein [Candidatus Binatus sp.]
MSRSSNITGTVIAAVIGCAFVVYLLFIDKLATRTYQARVALDGKEPFNQMYPPNTADIVILYRDGRNGVICYDAFRSKELHDRLSPKNGQLVTVQYDTFSDFGKIRGYNVRSVDGMMLANGYHVLRPEFAAIAGVIGNSVSKNDCW